MVNPLSSGGVKMTIINKKNYIPNGSLIYHTDGSATNHQGFTINHLDGMKASTEYMVSFKAKVILGQVKSIGVLKKINHTTGEILLDNVKLSDFNTHTAVTNTTINNGEFHEILITFTTAASPALVSDNISDVNVLGDVFFVNYDQPAECSIEIKDLKWEVKGDYPTKWSRPPEDLTVPFEMIDAYTKDETDHLLDNKANVVDVYTKTDSYNKEEVDKLIEDVTGSIGGGGSGGGSSVDAYTKVEVDEKLKNYLPTSTSDSKYCAYGGLQIDTRDLTYQTNVFRIFDYDLTSMLFQTLTSGIHVHKKLYIYDGVSIPDQGQGDIDVAFYTNGENHIGSSLIPTVIESSEIPLVQYNGIKWNIATEAMVNEAVDMALKKAGTSAIFMNDDDYMNRITIAIADRARNDLYKITAEQLNTLLLDSGVYHCEQICDMNGNRLTKAGAMVIIHTASATDSKFAAHEVFYSEQIAYDTEYSSDKYDQGRKFTRLLRYETANKKVIPVKDWSLDDAVPFGYEIDQIKLLTTSMENCMKKIYVVNMTLDNGFDTATMIGYRFCLSNKGITTFNGEFIFNSSYASHYASFIDIGTFKEEKFKPKHEVALYHIPLASGTIGTVNSKYIGYCDIVITSSGVIRIAPYSLTCDVQSGVRIIMGGQCFPNYMSFTDFQ